MKIIETSNAPKAIGPYSQGINYNNLVFTSGQIPIDPITNSLIKSKPGINMNTHMLSA